MSTSTLGARFAKIQAGKSDSKSQFQVNKAQRVASAVGSQKGKRNAKLDQARGIQSQNNGSKPKGINAKPKQNNKANKGPAGKKVAIAKKGNKGEKKNNSKPAKPTAKPAKPTAETLDMQMDNYWFQAGKGPDPKKAELDRQLDSYFSVKPTAEPQPELST